MSILEFRMDFAGETMTPRIGRLSSSDTLSTVTSAGYLNPILTAQGLTLKPSDFVFVSASNGNQIYKPSINATTGIVTLVVLP